jgi:hypothetical protein
MSTQTPPDSSLPFSSTFFYQGRLAKYLHDEQANLTISHDTIYPITSESEDGLLVGFEIATNKAEVIMEVIIYGDNIATPFTINNFTMKELLALGRGITPGDAEPAVNLRSKDPIGIESSLYPYIARWKDELLADYLGFTDRKIVLRFTPSERIPYKRIIVNIKNTNTEESANIQTFTLTRIIFQDAKESGIAPPIKNRGLFGAQPVSEPTPSVKVTPNMNYDFTPLAETKSKDDEEGNELLGS